MIYVLDTNSFIVLGHYFPNQFPSFWQRFNECVQAEQVISVREVFNELKREGTRRHLLDWLDANKKAFLIPSDPETEFVAEIFAVPHFRQMVGEKQRLKGTPVADPFVIACAKVRNACVVTEEDRKPNSAKIPNVCDHFGIDCTNIEGFMAKERWTF